MMDAATVAGGFGWKEISSLELWTKQNAGLDLGLGRIRSKPAFEALHGRDLSLKTGSGAHAQCDS